MHLVYKWDASSKNIFNTLAGLNIIARVDTESSAGSSKISFFADSSQLTIQHCLKKLSFYYRAILSLDSSWGWQWGMRHRETKIERRRSATTGHGRLLEIFSLAFAAAVFSHKLLFCFSVTHAAVTAVTRRRWTGKIQILLCRKKQSWLSSNRPNQEQLWYGSLLLVNRYIALLPGKYEQYTRLKRDERYIKS